MHESVCNRKSNLDWIHDDVIKWDYFPRHWPFVWGIHWSPVNSPHKGQWRGALMFSLICARISGWVNTGEAGDLRCHRAHYDLIVMWTYCLRKPECVVTTKSNRLAWITIIYNMTLLISPINVSILYIKRELGALSESRFTCHSHCYVMWCPLMTGNACHQGML